jgi:hypothetical protein
MAKKSATCRLKRTRHSASGISYNLKFSDILYRVLYRFLDRRTLLFRHVSPVQDWPGALSRPTTRAMSV